MIRERTISGRVVRAECDASRGEQAERVLDVVERLSAPVDGTTFRFGWSRLCLLDDGDALRVGEPDFARWPDEQWTRTIDTTLAVLSDQVALLHTLGVEGEDVSYDQVIIAAPNALAATDVYVRRTPAGTPPDSGWLLATLADPEALTLGRALEAVPIATLVVRRRALLQALTLPTEFTALFSGDRLTEVLDAAGHPKLGREAKR